MASDTGSAGLSYQASDQEQRRLFGAAVISLNNTDWCGRDLLMTLQSDNMGSLRKSLPSRLRTVCVSVYALPQFDVLFALWKLMYFNICRPFMDFLVCLSCTVNNVFMCLLSSRMCAWCHGLNKHDTITGCKWARPNAWDLLLFHTHLISLQVAKWKQMHRAAWSSN